MQSSITTSNRELQKQYGRDLDGDSLTKVIMGMANYRCSLFKEHREKNEDYGKQILVGQAPCQDDDTTIGQWWNHVEEAYQRSEAQIETCHEDQDFHVLDRITDTTDSVDEMLGDLKNKAEEKGEDPKDPDILELKNTCKDIGSCSYYHARSVADSSSIVVRSLQHLIFYIMFKLPLLQQRDVHIVDEFHVIESVFREHLSTIISEKYYIHVMSVAHELLCLEKEDPPFIFTDTFSKHKLSDGKKWTEHDILILTTKLQKELEEIVERLVVPLENEARNFGVEKIPTARSYATAMVKGELAKPVDDYGKAVQSIIKWYLNITVAIQEINKVKTSYGMSYNWSEDKQELCVFPVFLEKAKRFFGREHTLLMSATPIPKKVFEKMFEIQGEVVYIDVPSDFPPERSPIYFVPVGKMTDPNAKEIGSKQLGINLGNATYEDGIKALTFGWDVLYMEMAKKIEEIVEKFHSYTGVIPCNSYKMVKGLMTYLQHNPRFVWVTTGAETKANVRGFRERVAKGEYPILVSASISEGHSFDDGISRLQIIPKMPFPSIDAAMKILMNGYGKPYYESKTVATIQQMCGRSMRSKTDYCVTIVLDSKFEEIKTNKTYREICAPHFLECIRWDGDWENYIQPD